MRTQGEGGVKKRSNFSDVLYGWPQWSSECRVKQLTRFGHHLKVFNNYQMLNVNELNAMFNIYNSCIYCNV